MADPRGGARVPNKPSSYSGVGKNAKRTDGRIQPQRMPRIQDGTDLTQGEGEIIKRGQRAQPLSRTPSPQVTPPRPQVSPSLGPSGMQEVPGFIASMPSTRPMEDPSTAAQNVPDPDDDREFVLQMLSSAPWGNEKVRAMLNDLQRERAQPVAPTPMAPQSAIQRDEIPAEPSSVEELQEPVQELGAEEVPEEAIEEDFI